MLNQDQYEDEEEELDEDYNSDDLQKQTNDEENLVVNHNSNVKNQNDIKTSNNNENYNKDNKDQNNNIEVTTSLDNNINTKINSSSVHDIYIDRLAFYKNKHKFDDDELKEFSNENYFYDMSSKNLHFHMIFQRGSLVDITQLSSIIACYKLRQSNSSKITFFPAFAKIAAILMEANVFPSQNKGVVRFEVKEGLYHVLLRFERTPVVTIANTATLLSLIILAVILIKSAHKKYVS